ISRGLGVRTLEGSDLGNLGLIHRRWGDIGSAMAHFEQALEISRGISHSREHECQALTYLGAMYAEDLGELRTAIAFFEQALAITREMGTRHIEGTLLTYLGSIYCAMGEVQRALTLHEQGLAIQQETGSRWRESRALLGLGEVYQRMGDIGKAIEYYAQVLAI